MEVEMDSVVVFSTKDENSKAIQVGKLLGLSFGQNELDSRRYIAQLEDNSKESWAKKNPSLNGSQRACSRPERIAVQNSDGEVPPGV